MESWQTVDDLGCVWTLLESSPNVPDALLQQRTAMTANSREQYKIDNCHLFCCSTLYSTWQREIHHFLHIFLIFNGIHPIKNDVLLLLCYCTGGGKSLQKYRYFCMAFVFDLFKPRFLSLLRAGADSCQIWRHDVFMSQLCIVLPLVFRQPGHCAMRGKKQFKIAEKRPLQI